MRREMEQMCFNKMCEAEERQRADLCSLLSYWKENTAKEKENEDLRKAVDVLTDGLQEEYVDDSALQGEYAAVVEAFPCLMQFVPNCAQSKDMCAKAVEKDPYTIRYVAPKFLTYELCLKAVELRWNCVTHIPMEYRTGRIYQIVSEMCQLPNCTLLKY